MLNHVNKGRKRLFSSNSSESDYIFIPPKYVETYTIQRIRYKVSISAFAKRKFNLEIHKMLFMIHSAARKEALPSSHNSIIVQIMIERNDWKAGSQYFLPFLPFAAVVIEIGCNGGWNGRNTFDWERIHLDPQPLMFISYSLEVLHSFHSL